MTREPYLHEIDLGKPLGDEEIRDVIGQERNSPAVKAVLQLLRNQTALVEKAGRQPPAVAGKPVDARDYRAYHDGGADALEEVFRLILDCGSEAESKD